MSAESVEVPEATLAENLSYIERRTARLEAESAGLAGTGVYPEWWVREALPLDLLRQQLQSADADPGGIPRYFQLQQRQADLRATITGHHYDISPIQSITSELGLETVVRGFRAEATDGPLHAAVLATLTDAPQKRSLIVPELELLRNVYNTERLGDLLGVRGDEYSDALRPLLRNANAVRLMRYVDQKKSHTMDEIRANVREWMARTLSSVAGISETEADGYVFAASRRVEDESILTIIDRFEHPKLGAQRLRDLAAFTGIHAFEGYAVDQLLRMQELFSQPKEAAERLERHDVNVVMINRVGDYSGIMSDTAANFEDGNNRTLFFEINNLGDIYRHMLALRKLGVRPSTLVLGAHSAEGQFIVSDIRDVGLKRSDIATIAGRNLVRTVSQNGGLEAGESGYSMHGMKGLARLVGELMQPSRCIDDAQEDLGRKKILFQACHAASETESRDVDNQGVKFVVAMDSVISRLGKDLVEGGVQDGVDIYGASSGVQLHRSGRGVRYSGQPASLDEGRLPLRAVRMRLQQGAITRDEVDEIVLRRAA